MANCHLAIFLKEKTSPVADVRTHARSRGAQSMTRRISFILISLAILLGIALPAQAKTLSPKVFQSPGYLCLAAGGAGSCFVGSGSSQASLGAAGANTFHAILTSSTYEGNPVYAFEDNSGNCIRGGNGNVVKMATCDYADDPEQKWIKITNSDGSFKLENYGHTGNYMGTDGILSGQLIWYEGEHNGYYVSWELESPTG